MDGWMDYWVSPHAGQLELLKTASESFEWLELESFDIGATRLGNWIIIPST
jgi:hypothetical protein